MIKPDILSGLGTQGADRARTTRALKDLVRKQFGLDADAPVFVAEIACGEIDCPDTETVIAVFLAGERREFRIVKPIAELTGADIAAACQ